MCTQKIEYIRVAYIIILLRSSGGQEPGCSGRWPQLPWVHWKDPHTKNSKKGSYTHVT